MLNAGPGDHYMVVEGSRENQAKPGDGEGQVVRGDNEGSYTLRIKEQVGA